MPCYDPEAEEARARREREWAERGNMLCEACRLLRHHGFLNEASPELRAWAAVHRQRDNSRGEK